MSDYRPEKVSEDYLEKLIRKAGFGARIAGRSIESCPYIGETFSAKAWEDGWRQAHYELQSAKRLR